MMQIRAIARWLTGCVLPLFQQTLDEWNKDDGNRLAATVAYYAAFSFFPLLLVLTAALGLALRVSPGAQDAQQQILSLVARDASPALASQLEQLLLQIKIGASISGPLGVLILLIGAVGIFAEIDAAFIRIWKIAPGHVNGVKDALRRALIDRLQAFLMLLGLGVLLVAVFIAGLVASEAQALASGSSAGKEGWPVVQTLINVVVNAAVFAVIYDILPRPAVRWRDAWIGGLLASVIWEIGRQMLGLLVIANHYNAYGIIGSFIALLAWIYYASTVLYLGAEFTQVLGRRHAQDVAPERKETSG